MTELLYTCHRLGLKTYGVLVRSWRVVRRLCGPGPRPCHLLDLPVEVRMRIWEYALTGYYIAVHDDQGKLAFGILNEAHMRTPGRLLPYSAQDVEDDITYITGEPFDENEKPYGKRLRPHKMPLTALLKACRLIYTDAIDLLYASNTFVFLQNPALEAFYNATAKYHFNQIRSIHIHWQYRTVLPRGGRLSPWHTEQCRQRAAKIIAGMLNLERLSVYMQGWLHPHDYDQILKGMASGVAHPKFYVARVMRVSPPESDFNRHKIAWLERIRSASGEYGALRLIQPDYEPGRKYDREHDDDNWAILHPHWRIGALFEPEGDVGDNVSRVCSYVVCTPLERRGLFGRGPLSWNQG